VASVEETRKGRLVADRWKLGAALLLLACFVGAHFKTGPGANQVVGSPTRAQVTGNWVGDYGSLLDLRPDGTFTSAALPPQVGSAAPVLNRVGVVGTWSGHGTWAIGPGDPGPESVIFTVDCDAAPGSCAGHPKTFKLLLETNSPQGGGGPALFYYLGGTGDLDNQFPYVRVPS
jgi:hypothetical protein